MLDQRGYYEASFATVGLGGIASLATKYLMSWLLYPIAGMFMAYLVLAMILFYFASGFRQVPVGSRGVKLFLGKRTGKTYVEGWAWNYPAPFGDIMLVGIRKKPLDLKITEILAKDNVKVDIDMALQIQITDPIMYLNSEAAEEMLQNATESDIRSIVSQIESSGIAQEKGTIVDTLKNGSPSKSGSPLEGIVINSLIDSVATWGIEVVSVQITQIRLPQDVEQANADIRIAEARQRKEQAEIVAETTEAEHVARMIKVYRDAGLDPTTAAAIAQSERGKATRIIIDGNGSPIEKAGALAGGLLNQVLNQPSQSQPSLDTGPKPQRRRQSKEK